VAPSLEDLLRAATVRVEGGPRSGAGFFIAPGLVVTCAHVVGEAAELHVISGAASAEAIPELRLTDRGRPIPDLDEDYPDIALLRIEMGDHPCVALDEDMPTYGDRFQIYGFPTEGGSDLLTAASLEYRGIKAQAPTEFIDLASDTVKPGMSGGPLLNLRSRGVCGVVVATRSPSSPDGGLAVSWIALGDRLTAVITANRAFHREHRAWQRAARPSRRRVRFGLPLVARSFAGRGPELEALERALGGNDRAVVTQSIVGLGGVGKTQLAARYMHDHLDEYDVGAWVRAEDGGLGDLALLAVELGEPVEQLTPPERAEHARRWFERCEERWLLVLDNLASPEQLAGCCPSSGNGRVIATSRHRGLDQFGPTLNIDVFDEATGANFLVARAGRPNDREAARRLCAALGGLPLALAHAGAYCAAGTTFDEYHDLLTLPTAEVFDENPEAFYAQTVASTWQVSINAATEQAPLAPAALNMAAYLAPEKIPRTLFDILMEDAGQPRQRKQLSDALNALHRFSLAEVSDAVSVHRLLQKTVRDEATTHDNQQGQLAAQRALTQGFPENPILPAWWPQCEELLPHILALADAPIATSDTERLVALLNSACDYLLSAQLSDQATGIAQRAVTAAKRTLGAEHPETLTARGNLAFSYWSAGRTGEAIELQERVLDDRERILGAEHPDTVAAREALQHLSDPDST
jgi:GTPase SAR1 family protein